MLAIELTRYGGRWHWRVLWPWRGQLYVWERKR